MSIDRGICTFFDMIYYLKRVRERENEIERE